MSLPEQLGYHRLETDAEFISRVLDYIGRSAYKSGWIGGLLGERLDEDVWFHFKMQRRMIYVP